jgi:hypothetical protein
MLDADVAKTLAKGLKTKVICFVNSDTAGICEYELFDAKGKSRERFLMSDRIEFRSDLRDVTAPALGPMSLPFVNDFFREQDAFAPACAFEFCAGNMRAGDRFELKAFDQIPTDAVARMDVIS